MKNNLNEPNVSIGIQYVTYIYQVESQEKFYCTISGMDELAKADKENRAFKSASLIFMISFHCEYLKETLKKKY